MALRTTGMTSAAGMADNPFGGGGGAQTTALALANQTQPMGGVMLELPNGTKIRVASEADAQLLKSWYQSQQQQQTAMTLGGGGGGGWNLSADGGGSATTRALRVAADGANALSGFFAGRDFRQRIGDYDDAQEALDRLHEEFRARPATTPITNQDMTRLIAAQQDVLDAQSAVLETQISAVDIQTGAGVANVVGSFVDSRGSMMSGGGSGGGAGTALALGGAGIGAALLLSRDSRDRRRRR